MRTILLISPYWKEPHRWMVSSFKLAELWQRLGYRVVVACMGSPTPSPRGGGGHMNIERVSEMLTIYRMKDFFLKDPWNYGIALGFSGLVMKIIREEKPDRIVINKLLFWTALAGIRLRLTGHKFLLLTDAFVGITWWPRGWLPKMGAAIYTWTLGWLILLLADRVVTFHPQPASLLRKMMIAGKTQVIPTGIDLTPYPSSPIPRPLPPVGEGGGPTVTYVGRLESVKGVEDFLTAAVPLKDHFPSLTVQVVGWYPSPSSGQVLHPLVAQYQDEVTFTGLREDIPALLAATDIFVLPSYSEGLSNALMEAMASGCACIASDVGGNRFLIQNGVSGFLFPAGDREALAAHIRRLLEDPAKRKSLGDVARRRIEEKFSWKVVGEEWRRVFEEQKTPV